MDYYKVKAVSFSQLKHMMRSDAHFWYNCVLNPNRPEDDGDTDALRFGRAMHAALLEPSTFTKRYSIGPDLLRNTKEGKAAWADFLADPANAWWIKAAEADLIAAMATALTQQDMLATDGRRIAFAEIFQKGQAEKEFYWTDPETGVPCKCKTDWLMGGLVVDYKTCQDARPHGFTRSVAQYKYYMQAAFYLMGVEAATGEKPRGFIFIAQEKEAPFCAAAHKLDDASMEYGRAQVRACLKRVADGLSSGKWPGYGSFCNEITLPNYEFDNAQ